MTASDTPIVTRIRENVARVRDKIAAAAARAGRSAEEIRLVGVTKYVEPEIARMLLEAGVADLGESRPQELWRKAQALADLSVRWHLIGHLQRNKVRRTLECFPFIHSVDSLRLLEEIDKESEGRGKPVDVLLEVNVSCDVAKHGLMRNEIESLFPAVVKLDHVHIHGLMTMSGLDSGPDQTRREFAGLRDLAERLKSKCAHNIRMDELSMGMSDDFEIAIEEGATIVRIGSALFEGVKP